MKISKIKTFYRRTLPHIQPIGSAFFVTFRLNGSIPGIKLLNLKQAYEERVSNIRDQNFSWKDKLIYQEQQRFFEEYDKLLDTIHSGPDYLKRPEIASLIRNELHRFDNQLYELIAYCIMPNHVHILIDTATQIPENMDFSAFEKLEFEPLQIIMKRIKGPTAVYANRVLKRQGQFWQRESYDHYVRNEKEFGNIISYILENPVKAGIVKEWREFPYSYLKTYP